MLQTGGDDVCMLSPVWLFATPWAIAQQTPLSMEFSRQEYWSRLPFPSPGDFPNPGTKPTSLASPALAGRFFYQGATWEAPRNWKQNVLQGQRDLTGESEPALCQASHILVRTQRKHNTTKTFNDKAGSSSQVCSVNFPCLCRTRTFIGNVCGQGNHPALKWIHPKVHSGFSFIFKPVALGIFQAISYLILKRKKSSDG